MPRLEIGQCLALLEDTIKEVPLTEKQRTPIAMGLDGFRESIELGVELAKRLKEYQPDNDEATNPP